MQKKKRSPLYAIAAMARNRVIGKNNQLPWHIPADMKRFKTLTTGGVVIMGRKTYAAIGNKLPNRINIIVTRDKNFNAPGCLVAHSIEQAIEQARCHTAEQLFIIGGSEIYTQALPYLQKIYLTIIDEDFEGDAFFPELNPGEWHEIKRETHLADEKNPYIYLFVELERAG